MIYLHKGLGKPLEGNLLEDSVNQIGLAQNKPQRPVKGAVRCFVGYLSPLCLPIQPGWMFSF